MMSLNVAASSRTALSRNACIATNEIPQITACAPGTPTMTVAIGGEADYECEGDRHQARIECRAQPELAGKLLSKLRRTASRTTGIRVA
jgi:hypothetical protein